MQRQFIRMSELDRRARQDVERRLETEDTGANAFSLLIGGSASVRDWFESARRKHLTAMEMTGFERVNHLIGALYDAYRGRHRLDLGKGRDKIVDDLVDRIETSYANTVLEYVDAGVRNEETVRNDFELLMQAVRMLEEENPRMAANFAALLKQALDRENAADKMERLLDIPAEDIDPDKAREIAKLFSMHERSWKADPGMYDSMLSRLRNAMEGVYLYAGDRIRSEEESEKPSIRRLLSEIERFRDVYLPMKPWVHDSRYQKLIARAGEYGELLNFLDREYPALRKTYMYLGLPRESIDRRAILEQYRSIEKFDTLLILPWKELAELDPPLAAIAERMETTVSESQRKELIKLHRLFSDLLDARDSEEKVREMIRFGQYLRIQQGGKDDFLGIKLRGMTQQLDAELERLLERRFMNRLSEARENVEVQRAFEELLNHWAQAENLDKVEETQARKIAVMRDLERFRDLTSELAPMMLSARRNELHNLLARLKDYSLQWVRDWEEQHRSPDSGNVLENDRRLVLMDRFSPRNLVIFMQPVVALGRAEDNDIVLAFPYVSSYHAELDFGRQTLTDLGSTNGTFADDGKVPLKQILFSQFDRFNLAQGLSFRMRCMGKARIFMLDAVTDSELDRDPQFKEALDALRNTEFVYLADGASIALDRETGRITDLPAQIHLRRIGSQIYYTDVNRDLKEAPLDKDGHDYSERFSIHWV